MNYAIILAAGISQRITEHTLPKQFIEINQQPLIIECLKTFINIDAISKIIIVVHAEWKQYLETLLKKANFKSNNIEIVIGGASRNASLLNGIKYLQEAFHPQAEDIILTHDAARVYVTPEIILNNIKVCQTEGACNTAIASTDTIFMAEDRMWISSIPSREKMFNSQTPQTFKWSILADVYLHHQFAADLFDSVDASTLVLKTGYAIKVVPGHQNNFKITTDQDIENLKNKFK